MSLPIAPITLAPWEGPHVWIKGVKVTLKVVREATEERFGLFGYDEPAHDSGPPLHIHQRMIEMLHVQAGTVTIRVGEHVVQGQPGSFVLVPKGMPHAFNNPTSSPSKLLIMFTPADARQGYFQNLADLYRDGRQPSREALLELMHRYDQYLVEGN